MTSDTQLRTRLASAVDDTTVPPGLARAALSGGRRRRRRRTAGVLAVAAAVVGGSLLLPGGGPLARDGQVAGGTVAGEAALAWARSLPMGDAPALPFFGEGGLWSDGQMYDAPDEVNYAYPPREVLGGWLVVTGHDEERLGLAVMAPDGSLRDLPVAPSPYGAEAVVVSGDGREVAFRDVVVDLATMDVSPVPHRPGAQESGGYITEVRMIGWTGMGLVYEGAPYEKGLGTTWVLRADGTAQSFREPRGAHIPDGSPPDVALGFDYTADESDTCVRFYVLDDPMWREQLPVACMGRYLDEALGVSPDRRWLLTDDLPEVWDLEEGRWGRVDMSAGVGRQQMDAQMGGVVWEGEDSFLLPVSDRWDATVPMGESYDHDVQVVRCTMSTGACERAGEEQYVRVTTSASGTSELRFAQP